MAVKTWLRGSPNGIVLIFLVGHYFAQSYGFRYLNLISQNLQLSMRMSYFNLYD